MKNVLKHKHTRKIFISLVIVFFAFISLLQIFFIPEIENSNISPQLINYIKRILDSFMISLLVSIIIATVTNYFEIPDTEKKFDILEPYKLKEQFSKSYNNLTFWYFTGGLGRYTRDITLKKIDEISRTNDRHIRINIAIINPANINICSDYAKYRHNLNSAKSNYFSWDSNNVKLEILTTIIIIAIYKSNNDLLDIDLRLKNSFSTLRSDINDNDIFITKEDMREASIYAKKDSFIYRTYLEDFNQSFKFQEKIDLTLSKNYNAKKITSVQVLEIFKEIKLLNLIEEVNIEILVQKIKKNDNPYI